MATNQSPFGGRGGGWLAGVLGGETANPAGYEPQRANSAILYIADVAGGSDSYDTLSLSLASFQLPKVQTGESVIPFLNEHRNYAGGTTYDRISVNFHDYVDRGVARILWAWRKLIQDPATGVKGYKSQYAKQGWIELYPPGAVSNTQTSGAASLFSSLVPGSLGAQAVAGAGVVARYDIINMWPSHADFGDINYGSDDHVMISVTFMTDKFIPRDGLV
jgi:hypothetical protein